ncbi:Uncharacterised protein [Mycobacteroides abscessus subsp. abscessus]|nr:Uncharacterised protein [Mycobacteroides abscessus subsp. abscessus]
MHDCIDKRRSDALEAARQAARRHTCAHDEAQRARAERDAAVTAARDAGVRLTTIAREVGVSVQRIHQLVHTTTTDTEDTES